MDPSKDLEENLDNFSKLTLDQEKFLWEVHWWKYKAVILLNSCVLWTNNKSPFYLLSNDQSTNKGERRIS